MSVHHKLPNGDKIVVRGFWTSAEYTVEVVLSHPLTKWDLSYPWQKVNNRLLDRAYITLDTNKRERKQMMRNLARMWEVRLLGEQS